MGLRVGKGLGNAHPRISPLSLASAHSRRQVCGAISKGVDNAVSGELLSEAAGGSGIRLVSQLLVSGYANRVGGCCSDLPPSSTVCDCRKPKAGSTSQDQQPRQFPADP